MLLLKQFTENCFFLVLFIMCSVRQVSFCLAEVIPYSLSKWIQHFQKESFFRNVINFKFQWGVDNHNWLSCVQPKTESGNVSQQGDEVTWILTFLLYGCIFISLWKRRAISKYSVFLLACCVYLYHQVSLRFYSVLQI